MDVRRCGRCEAPLQAALLCTVCGAVQEPSKDMDYFTALGLPAHPAVDVAALSASYYDLSRRLHPDRFQSRAPAEIDASVRATALLNAAFRSLRDVENRARYWLEHIGEDLGRDNNRVPPRLAAEVFEVQEKLAELRETTGEGRMALLADLDEIRRELGDRRSARREELDSLLRAWPEGATSAADERRTLKDLLSELSYLRTLERDVCAATEA